MKPQKPLILIVDDDQICRMGLSFMLNQQGYETEEAFSGKKALEILEKNYHKIDIIILDRMMPEMSGIDFLYKIYPHPLFNKIPVIMLTSHAEREHVKTAFMYGAYDVVFKPIEEVLLFSVLKRALSKNKILKNKAESL